MHYVTISNVRNVRSILETFIDTHPFIGYRNITNNTGKDIGFFKWTWELHNQVNKFLNKYEPTLIESYNFYTNPEHSACFNCGETPPITTTISDQVSLHQQHSLPTQISQAIPEQISQAIPEQISQVISDTLLQSEQRSRAIPQILTAYRTSDRTTSQTLKLISHT